MQCEINIIPEAYWSSLPGPVLERRFERLDYPNHVAKDVLPPIQQLTSSHPGMNHQLSLLQTG